MNYSLKRKKGLNEMKMVLLFVPPTERKEKNVMFIALYYSSWRKKICMNTKLNYIVFKIILQ